MNRIRHHRTFLLLCVILSGLWPAVARAQDLFVLNYGTNYVGPSVPLVLRYDGGTGSAKPSEGNTGAAFIPYDSGVSPNRFTFGSDGNLYLTDYRNHEVLRYNGQTGAFIDAFIPSGSGSLNYPVSVRFGPHGNLFVAGNATAGPGSLYNGIYRYDGTTGTPLPAESYLGGAVFVPGFVFDKPEQTILPRDFTFGPDGTLYVVDAYPTLSEKDARIMRYDGQSGAFVGALPGPASPDGLWSSAAINSLVFGPDQQLYAAATRLGILRYEAEAQVWATLVAPGDALDIFGSLAFGPDGSLYVGGYREAVGIASAQIVRFDGQTGTYRDTFIPPNSGGLYIPYEVAFGPPAGLGGQPIAIPEADTLVLIGGGVVSLVSQRVRRRRFRNKTSVARGMRNR